MFLLYLKRPVRKVKQEPISFSAGSFLAQIKNPLIRCISVHLNHGFRGPGAAVPRRSDNHITICQACRQMPASIVLLYAELTGIASSLGCSTIKRTVVSNIQAITFKGGPIGNQSPNTGPSREIMLFLSYISPVDKACQCRAY